MSYALWRLIVLEIVVVIVALGVWFGAPLIGITSVGWRIFIIFAVLLPPMFLILRDLFYRRGFYIFWRVVGFLILAALVVLGIWYGAPLVGIKSVGWRVAIICALLLPPLVFIVWRLVRQRRASRGLEAGIREQAKKQQERVRPDRRQEVEVLRDVFTEAITALKKSKIGGGGRALYALPWYMIIGPPAVGKSTALLQSGLRFPFSTGDRKAVKGVGGTRNCDWWFSEDAILLDTAGRYASEDDDQEEWVAFLRLLKKYRRKRPLNGLIVASSIGDVVRASPEEREELAVKLRSRVDQLIEELDLALPIYVLFTKCDLVSGFIQYFGDLGKSARAQVLGFTVPITGPGSDVETLCRSELDLLLGRLHQRALWRLGAAKPGQRREVYQFPLQLEASSDALVSFVNQLMVPNPYLESPRLRGVYFCSGTQEGRPFDTVMAMVSRGMGLKELAAEGFEQSFQKKSYFLRNVFTEVMFPDAPLAGATASTLSRRYRLSLAALGASVLVTTGMLAPTCVSFGNNRLMGSETAAVGKRSYFITHPEDPKKVRDGHRAVDKLGTTLDLLVRYAEHGPPWSLGLGFYQGNKLFDPVQQLYIKRMRQAFVLPAGSELEATLIDIANTTDSKTAMAAAGMDFNLLKTYLMVSEPKRLDVDFVTPFLIKQWKKRLEPTVAEDEDLLERNAKRYLRLIKAGKARWLGQDRELVEKVRHVLRGRQAEYRALVGDIEHLYKPFTLRDALRGRVQTVLTSSAEVPGIYTRAAYKEKIQARLAKSAVAGSKVDAWVLGEDESQAGIAMRLRDEYFNQYISAWTTFLQKLKVEEASTAQDSQRILEALTETPPLFKEVLGAISFHTQFPIINDEDRRMAELLVYRMGGGVGRAYYATKYYGLDKKVPKNVVPQNRIERHFQPLRDLVEPGAAADGRAQISGLSQYQSQLENVREALARQLRPQGSGASGVPDGVALDRGLEEARRVTKGILAMLPGELRRPVGQLLLAPLEVTGVTSREHLSVEQAGAVNNELCAQFKEQMADRYPFARGKKDEAHLQDVASFFSPKGSLWRYYETKLQNDLVRHGDKFEAAPGRVAKQGMIALFDQAWRITRALYPMGSDTPLIRFQVRPAPAIVEAVQNVQVSEITFEVEGKSATYRNGPSEQWSFAWTGQDKRARLLVKGGAGLVEELSFQGEWALMRLLERARVQKRGSWYNVEWTLKGGVRVPMDFRPERTFNPLFMPLRLTCR